MRWPRIRLARPPRRQRTAWWTRLFWLADQRCDQDTHDVHWTAYGAALVGQCVRCRQNVTVVTQRPSRGIDATCSTDNRSSMDFDGATD